MIDEQIPVDESTQVLAGSLFLAKDTTVDQASEALRLGKTLNLPADFVSRNLDWARKRAETSINVDALQVSHPKTAQLLSDPMNAAATKDDLERLMAIEDVLREGSAEPGLMSKDARNMVIRSLRDQGYQIEEVPQLKGVFGRNLERTMKALSPRFPEIPEAPVQPSAVAAAPYMPPGARATITEAPQVLEPSTVPQAKEVTQLPIQPAGFLDTVQRNVARGQFIPFVASGVELAEANALYDTVRRVGSGEGTAKDWLDLLKVDAEIRRGTTWGGMVGSGISQMPSFMGEMAATGGLATAGRKAAVNLGLATAKRVLNKSARQVAMNLPLKSAIELGGWATKSALVGTVGNPVRVAANTLQRRIPALQNISENEFGDFEAFLKEPDESLAKSIFKAASQSSIEIGSEFSGGLLGKLGSKVAEATKLNAVKALVVGRWFKLHPTSGWSQFKERLKQVQFHGIIAEAGEEVVGDILTLLSQPLTDLETPDFNPEGYLAAAAAAAFIPGAGLLRYGPGMIAASNRLAQQAQAQVDFFRELGNEALQQKTRERVPGMLAMLGNMAAENGPVQSVFAPIEKWDAYFSARKMDPRAVAEQVLGSAEVYDRARQTGSDIEIPIGEYTEKLAPTEHNEVLSLDLRLGSSSAPTVNEMAEELRAQEAALDNLVKLNQSSEQLQARAATLEEQRVKLELDVAEAQVRLPEIQTRLDAIRQQFPQTPAEALVATLTGQTESPEMQALANEYQSLTSEVEKANSLQSELDSVRSEQAQVATQLQEISAEDAKFQAAFPSKNPEVKAFTDEMTQQLLNTGRYGRDAVAKVHASIFARMMYILGARSGLSLQQMRERFPVTITGQEPASAELYQMDARDAEYMAAVESGDMETAQRLVDEAAKAAGYSTKAYHGTSGDWSVFDPSKIGTIQRQDFGKGIYLAPDWRKSDAEMYASKAEASTNQKSKVLNLWVNTGREMYGANYAEEGSDLTTAAKDRGYDSVIVKYDKGEDRVGKVSEIIVFDPSQIKSADPVTRDESGNVIPLSQRFNPEKTSILYQGEDGNELVFPATYSTPLLAIHNISGENILNVAKLGGLAVPSIGVTRPDAIYTGFGEVSLIGTKELADPRRNPIFNADAYTVRFPQPEYGKIKQASANKIIKPLLHFQKLFNDYTPNDVWQRLVDRGDVAGAIDKLSHSEAAKAAFLGSKGITVEPVMREPGMNYGWSNSDTLKEYLTPERMKQAMAGDENIRRELVPVVESAIRDEAQKKNLDQKQADYLVNLFKRTALSTDGGVGFNLLNRIETDWQRAGQKEVDLGPTRDALDKALNGREAEFEQWVKGMILAESGEPKLTIGRKKVPFTLENIVEYMTSSLVKGVESTMTFGEGKARAMLAAKITDIEEMRNRAQFEIGTKEEVDSAREKASKLLSQYREKTAEHYGFADTWNAFDDSMKALAKWAKGARTTANLHKALKAEGFKNVPEDVLKLGVEAGKAFLNTPVPYFESKPQRSVALSEFKAAVVPSDTRKEVRQVLADAGVQVFDYIPHNDASRRTAVAQASQETQTLFQNKNQGPRGSIAFAPSERGQERREFTIAMLAKANASTFMHEAAHWYLESVLDLVASPNATDSLKADAATIRRWLKMDDSQDYPTSDQHETFARGFEKYLMEGVAPAEDVRGFFASMRMWLIRIYKDLLNPELDATLSDDIRRVFDRMVATEDEIDAAQAENGVEPMFMEKPAFMTDDQWERYSKFVIKASMQAREKLQTRLMKEIRDAQTQERLDEKERIREEVSAELNADRNHIALAFLRFGKQPNGEEVNGIVAPFKLDRDSVIALPSVTKEVRKKLKNLGVYRVEGGMDADAAANILGFQSGDELVTALASIEPFAKAVSTETQRRLDVLYPSMVQDEQELADAAAEAVRNEQRDEVIAAEMSALARRVRADEQAVGRVAAGAPLGLLAKRLLRANEAQALAVSQLQDLRLINELARQSANRTLSAQQIREIRPSLYLAAAKRASATAAKAVASGNFQQALAQKEAELVGHAMYRAAREIQKETEKMQRYLLRMSDDKALARLGKAGTQYREQVQAILERFQLRTTPLVRIEERLNLRKWIEAQEAQGFTVEISDALYDEAFEQDFRTMTFVEFRDVYNAVKQIDKLASLKNKLLKAERDRTFEAFKSEALPSMQEGRKGAVVSPRAKSKTERRFGLINGLFQSTRRLTDIVEELDRFKPFGPMFNGIQRPVNEAQNAQDIMTSEATETLRKLYEVYTDEERSQFKKRVNIQGATRVFQLSHEDRLCIALNWGNADNRKKLVDGYNGFTESDVEKILETLTEKDVKFVQSVWDFIDSFWPAIKAKQERVYGIAPEKVEPTPWVTKFGVMPGGYYPLKYTGAKAESESAADVAKQMMRGAVGFATTARGHTQARVEGVERPVKIGFDVLHNHVAMVIHDLTHHEMLIDVNRILNDAEISGTIAGFYSEEMLTELRDVVMDIASGGLEKKSPWESVATWLRTRSTVAGMAWNLWTVIQQTYGFTNAIPKLGPKGAKYMARALHAWLGDASDLESRVAAIHEKSTFMRMRSKTLDRDISELRNTVDPSKRTAITDSYFYLIGKGQMLADIPTWLAGYLYAKGELNASETDAIAYGDKLVEDTQGGGHIKAQAKVQRMGGAFFKLWTTFYSYSNALLNQNVQLIKRTEFKDPLSVGRLLVDMSVLNTLPLLISMLLKDLLKGDDGDEDPWYAKLAKEQVNSVFSMFPFVREIPGLLSGRKYEGPAGTRILPEIQKLTQSISKEVQENGLDPTEWDYDRPLVSSMFRTGGMFFNLPAPALQKTFEGAKALWEGTTTNPGVLIVGPTKEERK